MDNLPTLAQTVKQYGLSANKKLGQHFLLDMNITDKIARLAMPLLGVNVVEIGPGPGGLTRALFMNGASSVTAIEMDDRFIPALEEIGIVSGKTLNVIQGDALKINIPAIVDDPITIAANLPYNVGTKLLIGWLTADPLFWDKAVLMFQKEVAERVVAAPGESAYGRLAILSQSVCNCFMAFEVPARAFTPPPKVDSAVVVLETLPEKKRFHDIETLGRVTAAAFGQRRKMLRKSLKTLAGSHNVSAEAWLESCDIDPSRRPETLTVEEFQALTRRLTQLS